MTAAEPLALTDEQLRRFITNGYLVLQSQLPAEFHARVFEKLHSLARGSGHFGNNLLPLVPELNQVIEDPQIKAALSRILGNNYSLHAHRALHANPPGSDEQAWHKDSYWGYTRRVRNHRPWWAMLMYYPQVTTEKKGPTGLLSGSQYFHQLLPKDCCDVAACGAAGTFVLIHYDLWHRKMLNKSDLDRYMVKFQFTRLSPPKIGSIKNPPPWRRPKDRPKFDLNPIWQSTWDWLHGVETTPKSAAATDPSSQLTGQLYANDEVSTLNAAFQLSEQASAGSQKAMDTLFEALNANLEENDNTRRYADNGSFWRADATARSAAHGLVNAGENALKVLNAASKNGSPRGRKHAAFALGEIGTHAAQNILVDSLSDDDLHVVINAIEAIGLTPPTARATSALINCLSHTESEVRFDAALSLLRFAASPACVLKTKMVNALANSLHDSNRYVSAYAAQALELLGTQQALRALVPFLSGARWCSHTDNKTPF
jgi:ectoine hydroxylase-related dioxygenase (phytanoyl-CoA dioxygenase family)